MHLIPKAVAAVTSAGVIDVDGTGYPVDVLIMATGFQAANYLATMTVVGRAGQSLQDYWGGEPSAFLGITVPGFPNFFMLYGPNTNGGAIVSNLHRQSEYAVNAIRWTRRTHSSSIEVRPSAHRLYNRWLDRRIAGTSWTYSNNYYKAASGRVVTNFPDSAIVYAGLTKLFPVPLVARFRRVRNESNGDSGATPAESALGRAVEPARR